MDLILNVLNIVYNNISICISTDTQNTLHYNKNFQAEGHRRTVSFIEGGDKSTQLFFLLILFQKTLTPMAFTEVELFLRKL